MAVVPTAPTAPWAAWCADNGVRLIHIPCEIYKEKNPVNNTIASRVLEVEAGAWPRRRSAAAA